MTDEELDLVVARTNHERIRWLVSDENPDVEGREAWRVEVARRAREPWPPPPVYPSVREQARGLVASLAKAARTGFRLADRPERERRRAICTACPLFDAKRRRCTDCGCFANLKPWLADVLCRRGYWDETTTPGG